MLRGFAATLFIFLATTRVLGEIMKMEIEQPIDPNIDPNGEDLLSKGKKSLLNGGSGKYTTKETFVNLLGYKEPNLVHVMRCVGKCDKAGSMDQIGCAPTKCKHVSMMSCMGGFNNQTCECECDERDYGNERLRCELMRNTYWDATSCKCRSKSISPRGVEQIPPSSDCANTVLDQLINSPASTQSSPTRVEIISLILLGCFITVSLFLAASTMYYSSSHSSSSSRHDRERPEIPPKPSKSSKSKHKSEEMPREYVHTTSSNNHQQQNIVFDQVFTENAVMDDILLMGGDTCDKYDQHGVKIDYQYT